jgi:hypothetical protein
MPTITTGLCYVVNVSLTRLLAALSVPKPMIYVNTLFAPLPTTQQPSLERPGELIAIDCALHIIWAQPMQWRTYCLIGGILMTPQSLLTLTLIFLRCGHGYFARCDPPCSLPQSYHCPSSDAIRPLCLTKNLCCRLLDTFLRSRPDPIPLLKIFSVCVRNGQHSATGNSVRSGTVADALESTNK